MYVYIDCGNYYKYFINVAVRNGPKVESARAKNRRHVRMRYVHARKHLSTYANTYEDVQAREHAR